MSAPGSEHEPSAREPGFLAHLLGGYLIWRRRMRRLVLVALVVGVGWYLWHALPFWLRTPNVAVDYVAKLNERALALKPEERAWPGIRDALLAMRADRPVLAEHEGQPARPGEPRWDEFAAWVSAHPNDVAKLREETKKPGLGFVLDAPLAEEDLALFGPRNGVPLTGPYAPRVFFIFIPHMGSLREAARTLCAEARLSAANGDGETATADLVAMIRLAELAREAPMIICDLVAASIYALAGSAFGELLAEHPESFSDRALGEIRSSFAEFNGGEPVALRLEGEEFAAADLVQCLYSDDGGGDGHLTYAGLTSQFGMSSDVVTLLATPLKSHKWVSRAELSRAWKDVFAAARAWDETPIWDRDAIDGPSAVAVRIRARRPNAFWLVDPDTYAPVFERAQTQLRFINTIRDGVLVAIALEQHRRSAGRWAASLDELVPAFLPAAPLDPFSGAPLRLASIDGRPRLYSVGVDRDDDFGRPPVDEAGKAAPDAAMKWIAKDTAAGMKQGPVPLANAKSRLADGDWVLWPVIVVPAEPEEAEPSDQGDPAMEAPAETSPPGRAT